MVEREDVNPEQGRIYKVALASIVGSIIEQYDFLITGVIAATRKVNLEGMMARS